MEEHQSMTYFDFSEVFIGNISIEDDRISFPIYQFGVYGVYREFAAPYTPIEKCTLTFFNVSYSKREVYEYLLKPQRGFKDVVVIVDISSNSKSVDTYEFVFDVVSRPLNAWVHWTIYANDVHIDMQ
jgi:hypothetical protein